MKDPQYCTNSFYSSKLMIKQNPFKKEDHICFYGRFLSASWINLIMRRQNLSLQSTFPIKLYHNGIFNFLVTLILFRQSEEHPRVSQISEKSL